MSDDLHDYIYVRHSPEELLLVLESIMTETDAPTAARTAMLQGSQLEHEVRQQAKALLSEEGFPYRDHDSRLEGAFERMHEHYRQELEMEWLQEDRQAILEMSRYRLPTISAPAKKALAILLPNKAIVIAAYLALIPASHTVEARRTAPTMDVELRRCVDICYERGSPCSSDEPIRYDGPTILPAR